MSDARVYEVRCERCRTSFAPETRHCVHCGGPLGRRRLATALHEANAGEGEAKGIDEFELGGRIRNPLWIATAIVAVLASMIHTCTG